MSRKPMFFILTFIAFILIVGMACGIPKKGDPTATPAPPTAAPATKEASQEPTTQVITQEPVVGTGGKSADGLTLLDNYIFIQDETDLSTFLFLRNDDAENVYLDIQYTIHTYDAAGAQVENDSTTIGFLAPGDTIGMANELWLDEGVTVDKIEVDWIIDSKVSMPDYTDPFDFKNAKYYDDDGWKYLTGVITNSDILTYTDLRVSAIAFDASGKIIGGGYAYADFIPSEDQVGVSVYSTIIGDPVKIEFYPMVHSYSTTYEDGDWWGNLDVIDFGFVQDGTEVGGGVLLKNLTDKLIKDTEFYMTIYDVEGNVCGADSGYIDYIWPGETLGFSPGATYIPSNSVPENVDLIIMPGEFAEHELSGSPLVSEGHTFKQDEYWSTVTVKLKNMLNKTVTDTYVSVLLLDAGGLVIGGGSGWPEDFEANGTQELEIFVTYTGIEEPASIVVYPGITTWTEIGE